MKRRAFLAGATALGMMTAAVPAVAQTEYMIPGIVDFSGPFADLSKQLVARDAVVRWWNDTEGKKLNVKLTVKNYDYRYDGSVIASLWPGILSDLKPIAAFGLGGPDLAALQQRLPKDKVPVIYAPPSYGFGWLPNQWVFAPRATYVHEWMTALRWFAEQNPSKKPIKVAFMSTQSSPAFVDFVNGSAKYIKDVLEPAGIARVVATEWVEIQPVDVSSQMGKIVDAKADIIIGTATTTMSAAALRAEQLHGVSIPTLAATWHTIWPLAQAMKSFKPWEGHLVATGIASTEDRAGPAWAFYQTLSASYGQPKDWNPLNVLGMSQGLLLVRAVEHTAKRVGGDKMTGEAVYETLTTTTFSEEEMMGILPSISFTKDAPFPKDGKIKVETVKDGKYTLATPQWLPIPDDIAKW